MKQLYVSQNKSPAGWLMSSALITHWRKVSVPKLTMLIVILFTVFPFVSHSQEFSKELVAAAIERTTHNITYDGSYFSIAYPNGDVPADIGVCTDVIIRTYRAVGVDLQQLVHEDMQENFTDYPSTRIWGLTSTDKNIDHRRVPNLQTFFTRHGAVLIASANNHDYAAGDIVTWMLPGNLPHIGIVTDQVSRQSGNPLIVHNIGAGPKLEDMLFDYDITGHFRYKPKIYKMNTAN